MNAALLAKRVASRYKLAGLLDRDLIDRAVKAILSDKSSHATAPTYVRLNLMTTRPSRRKSKRS